MAWTEYSMQEIESLACQGMQILRAQNSLVPELTVNGFPVPQELCQRLQSFFSNAEAQQGDSPHTESFAISYKVRERQSYTSSVSSCASDSKPLFSLGMIQGITTNRMRQRTSSVSKVGTASRNTCLTTWSTTKAECYPLPPSSPPPQHCMIDCGHRKPSRWKSCTAA